MPKKDKTKEHMFLDSSLPSKGHPMAAWPGIGHVRPDTKTKTPSDKKNN